MLRLLEITALSLVALPLRTEVYRTGLAAAGSHPPRATCTLPTASP